MTAKVQRAMCIFLTIGNLSGYGSGQRWRGKASSMRAGAASCRFFCTAGPKKVRIRELRGTGKVPVAKEKSCCDKSGGSINNSDSKGLECFNGLQQFKE